LASGENKLREAADVIVGKANHLPEGLGEGSQRLRNVKSKKKV